MVCPSPLVESPGANGMASEKDLQNHLFRLADAHKIYCRKVVAVARVGFPDILLAHKGQTVLVELKSPTGKGRLSKMQEREIARLTEAGVHVEIISAFEDADTLIGNLLYGRQK